MYQYGNVVRGNTTSERFILAKAKRGCTTSTSIKQRTTI